MGIPYSCLQQDYLSAVRMGVDIQPYIHTVRDLNCEASSSRQAEAREVNRPIKILLGHHYHLVMFGLYCFSGHKSPTP